MKQGRLGGGLIVFEVDAGESYLFDGRDERIVFL